MTNDDLSFNSEVELATAIRARKISPLEVTSAALERIKQQNPVSTHSSRFLREQVQPWNEKRLAL